MGDIFTNDYYLNRIYDLINKIKDPDDSITKKIKDLIVIALLKYNESTVNASNQTVTLNIKGNDYTYKLEDLKEFKDVYSYITEKAKVNLSDLNAVKSEMQKHAETLKKTAYTDALTGLYNKNYFDAHITDMITSEITVIMGDVNFLKMVNDTQGHAAGDVLIKTIANALNKAFENQVYRIGGDEFYIVTERMREFDIADKLNQIKDELNSNSEIPKNAISFGWAFGDNKTVIELINVAEKRMYADKIKMKASAPNNGYKDDRIVSAIQPINTVTEDYVYNAYVFSIAGTKYRCLIAPLVVDEDNPHPIIFAYMQNEREMEGTFISSNDKPTLKIEFGNEEFILQGRFVDGTFKSSVLTSGTTLASGYTIDMLNETKIVPQNIYETKGHPIINKGKINIHAIPLSNKNNDKGICKALIGIESNNGYSAMLSNMNKNTVYENNQILTYRDGNGKFILEVL